MAWHTSGIATFADVQKRELVVGTGGIADDTYQFPAILNNMFGAKFKMVSGYAGGTEINIAMERGEVRGRCGFPWSTVKATTSTGCKEKKFNLLMQFSLAKHADLPDVPLVMDLATTTEQKQILALIFGRQVMGRPYAAPPGIPKDRVDALRKAFMATMADKDFIAEVGKAQFEMTPVPGEKLESDGDGHLPVDAAGGCGQGGDDGEIAGRRGLKAGCCSTGPANLPMTIARARPNRNAARRGVDGAVFRARADRRPDRHHSRPLRGAGAACRREARLVKFENPARIVAAFRDGSLDATFSASPPNAPRRSISARSCSRSRQPIWCRKHRRSPASRRSTAPACASPCRPRARRKRI